MLGYEKLSDEKIDSKIVWKLIQAITGGLVLIYLWYYATAAFISGDSSGTFIFIFSIFILLAEISGIIMLVSLFKIRKSRKANVQDNVINTPQ